MISSVSNSQMKHIIKLQSKTKERNEQGVFICEGRKMFEETRGTSHVTVQKTYVSESFFGEMAHTDPDYLEGISYELVSDTVFKQIADTKTPQGVLAIVTQPTYQLENMLNKEELSLLILEDIRDPGNLGTIIRTAEGAGVDGIILSPGCVDVFNPKVIRSTMGAIYRVPFVYVDDFYDTLNQLKGQKVSIYAAHLEGAVSYDAVSYPKKTAIVIGNEANGLTDVTAKQATACIKIPMEGNVESLNAGIASAILMYEVYRQRRVEKNL